jgi:hypothetical protein
MTTEENIKNIKKHIKEINNKPIIESKFSKNRSSFFDDIEFGDESIREYYMAELEKDMHDVYKQFENERLERIKYRNSLAHDYFRTLIERSNYKLEEPILDGLLTQAFQIADLFISKTKEK